MKCSPESEREYMDGKQYELRILPLFEQKLSEITDYITYTLRNSIAAENLVTEVEKAIWERLKAPEAFQPYPSEWNHDHAYYAIPVRNYLVFYVVIGNSMEVRTIVYSRRNLEKSLP